MWPDTCEKILVISPEKCENLQEEVSLNAIFHQLLHVGLFSTRKDQVVIFLDPKRAVFFAPGAGGRTWIVVYRPGQY